MKLAYLSGKYSDKRGSAFECLNIDRARHVAMQLWSLGIPTICPHMNTAHLNEATAYSDFLQGELLMVERVDLLITLPSWHESRGAQLEVEHARARSKEIFNWPAQLIEILAFCWPFGIPYRFFAASKETLPKELHEDVKHSYQHSQD